MSSPALLARTGFAGKYLILTGICLVGLGLMALLSLLFTVYALGLPVLTNPSLLRDFSNPQVIDALKLMQICQALGLFIVPSLLFAWLDSRKTVNYLTLDKKPGFYGLMSIALLMLSAQPLINWMAEVNGMFPVPQWMRDAEKSAEEITRIFLQMNSYGDLLINLFMIAIIPALGEELLFRGVIQKLLQRNTGNVHLAIWLSAAIFSALHMQFLGFIPRMVLGALFGYALHWSGSLWVPVTGHLVNNGMAVLLSWFIGHELADPVLEKVGTEEGTGWYVAASFIITASIVYLIYRHYQQARSTEQEEKPI